MKKIIESKKKYIVYILGIVFMIYMVTGVKSFSVEEVYPISGVGYDFDNDAKYNIPVTVYRYKGEEKIFYANITGIGDTISETRQTRQLMLDKVFKLGTERVLVISSNQAKEGIRNILNILFINPDINDSVTTVVCKDRAAEILSYKVKGSIDASEYIDGMIKNAESFNFLSKEYNLIKAYIKVESEGESLAIPYIELETEDIAYTGMAIFDKDKMVEVVKGDESNIFNILRHRRGTGVLTIQDEDGKALDYLTKVKRTVDCYKKDDTYSFVINLNFTGDVVVNNLYKNISKDNKKEIEDKLKSHIEEMSYDFIKKMKEDMKIDCLELGRQGAASYGRDTVSDWNKVVCSSDIKVNVKVKISKVGRGQY